MRIGVQSEFCVEVTKHIGYRLDVYSFPERDGCYGGAEIVEPDLWDLVLYECIMHRLAEMLKSFSYLV